MRKTLTFILMLLFSGTCLGIDFEDAIFPELAVSARAQAMGNAFIAKVDDSMAAFYNPAGLGTVRGGHFHLLNMHIEGNRGLLKTSSGGRLTDASGNFFKSFSMDGSRELLLESRGDVAHARLQSTPNLLYRYFTAGFLFNKHRKTTIGPGADDEFEYADRLDYGPYAALNVSLFGGVIKFGATGILLSRHNANGSAPNDEAFELQDSDVKKGATEYVVAGARLTMPIVFLPTFAAVLHNATGASFREGRGGGVPDDIAQQLVVGFSITPQITKTSRVHLEANYKDLNNAHPEVAAQRKLVFGMELDIRRTFFLRIGYGDGYGSAGIGIRTTHLEFDLTSYAVDTTSQFFRGKEDRRFSFSLSSGF